MPACRHLLDTQSLESRLTPATITVNSFLDDTRVNESVTLREAIASANATAESDLIVFDASLAGKTITLAGTQLPAVTGGLRIDGSGAKFLTIDGGGRSRILEIVVGAEVELSGLTFTRGLAAGEGPDDAGGAIANAGTLRVLRSTFTANKAGAGGAIANFRDGTAEIIASTISGNSAGSFGGGIDNAGTLTVTNATVVLNRASSAGGGVRDTGTAVVRNSIVVGNTLADGATSDNIAGTLEGGSGANVVSGAVASVVHVALADNGGPTRTHALVRGSPALDGGADLGLTADQRGLPISFAPDVGAFENQFITITPPTIQDPPTRFDQTLTASGVPGPFTFIATGDLPDGTTLAPDGRLSGAFTKAGTFEFVVTATAQSGDFGAITVVAGIEAKQVLLPVSPPPVSPPATLPATVVGIPITETLTVPGVTGPVTVTTGTLPPGLVLSPDGTLSGTPTSPGTFDFDVTVTSPAGDSGTRPYSITVAPVVVRTVLYEVGGDVGSGAVRVFNADGTERFTLTPFGADFTGGVRVATGDLNGDGVDDLVVGTGPGVATRVIAFDGVTQQQLTTIDPFEPTFLGGVFVAVGDIDGDGVGDILISPDQGGGPRVRIFSGKDSAQIDDFFGIDDPNFRGGARAATGDVNGDGRADVLVAAGFKGGPRVAVFDGKAIGSTRVKLFNDFFIFEDTLRNGAFIASGDIDGDGFAEVIGGGGPGGGPRVFALSGKDLLTNAQVPVANFFAGDVANRGGIRIVAKDIDGDAFADILAGDGTGAGSRVTTFLGKDIDPNGTPPSEPPLTAFEGFTNGVFVG